MWVLVFTLSSVPGLNWGWQHMPGLCVTLALQEVEAGMVRDRQPQPHSEFWCSLSCIRPCPKEIKRIKKNKDNIYYYFWCQNVRSSSSHPGRCKHMPLCNIFTKAKKSQPVPFLVGSLLVLFLLWGQRLSRGPPTLQQVLYHLATHSSSPSFLLENLSVVWGLQCTQCGKRLGFSPQHCCLLGSCLFNSAASCQVCKRSISSSTCLFTGSFSRTF